MVTNIFMNPYEQPENRLTYSFLCLVEHLSLETAMEVLRLAGFSAANIQSREVELLYGGGEGNPDGSITLNPHSDAEAILYLENKTWRQHLGADQVRRHAKRLRPGMDWLMVVASDRNDRQVLSQVNLDRVCFITWNELVSHLGELAARTTDSKEAFLLEQFVGYAESSGEAWRAKMVEKELLEKYSQRLKLKEAERTFLGQGWQLIDAVKDEVLAKFPEHIVSAEMQSHWGRVGAECKLRRASLVQFLFFGVYFDPFDHRIPFEQEFTPEFAVFVDIDPKNRERLATSPGILHSVQDLRQQKFEFNFPGNTCGNAWKLCYWRDSMSKHLNDGPPELSQMFTERLQILFQSEFYGKLEEMNKHEPN
jgi:hypothetical protein